MALMFLGNVAVAETVNSCGVLGKLSLPTETNNVGEVAVSDQRWFLSGTPGPNVYDPRVAVGGRVCLTGETARSDTGPAPLLIRWKLIPDPLPASTFAPSSAGTAPSASAVVSAPPASLRPSLTNAPSPISTEAAPVLVAALVAGLAIAVVTIRAALSRR
jgi:hypothetical protein